jgi:carbon-monoxide dehydrogenase large subunit
MMSGPYIVPSLSMDVTVAATNKTPVSSIRGAGYPQAAFAMERMMDRLARELKLDRAELRRRNLIPTEKMPYTKPLKARSGAAMQYDSGDYPACQAMVLDAAQWNEFPARQAAARREGRYIGIGLAHGIKGTGRGPFESGASPSSRARPRLARACRPRSRKSPPTSWGCAPMRSAWCRATPQASPLGSVRLRAARW